MKKIETFNHIDTETAEGKMLVSAVSMLMASRTWTPEKAFKKLNELTEKIYSDGNYKADDNRQRNPRPFVEATVCGTDETREGGNQDLGN